MAVLYDDAEDLVWLDGRDPQDGYLYPEDMATLGAVYGLGAVADFDAEKVWADIQQSNDCYSPQGKHYADCHTQPVSPFCPQGACNAASARATQAIREGLVELGYSDGIKYGAAWSESNPGAQWKKFLADRGMAPGPGLGVTKLGLQQMEAELKGEDDVVPVPPNGKGENDLPVPVKKVPWWAWAAGGVALAGGGYLLLR